MTAPKSPIFNHSVRFLFFLVNALALYLLLRGHDRPGGGFIAGLATAISFILLSLAIGQEQLDRVVRVDPMRMAAVGLALATLTGLAPLLFQRAFLEHFHLHLSDVPLLGELSLGTPLLFDVGVFLVVVGIACKIIFVLGRSTQHLHAFPADQTARYSSPVEKPIEGEPPPTAEQSPSPGKTHAT